MLAFRGELSEYREFEPGLWRREDADGNWIEEDGITTVRDGVTFAEIYARRANPLAPDVLVPYGQFRLRWTETELSGLFDARKQYWQVDDFVSLAAAQGHVNLTGDTAAAAKALFVSLGVLTEKRAEAIFAT